MTSIIVPASLMTRLAALVYDSLLVAGIWILGVFAVMPFTGAAVPAGTPWFRLYIFGLTTLFYLFFWCRSGQTLGMRAWRLQVRRDDGSTLSMTQAILRLLVCWFTVGLCFAWCLVDSRRRGLQDVISRSEVVRLPKGHAELT